MNILVIGSGGREHALIHAIKRSDLTDTVYAAPGNAGILHDAEKADIDITNFKAVAKWCKKNEIGLVVIGPEAPLVDGMADALNKAGIPAFGPSKAAAEIEGSKAFMKDIAKKYGIPTAEYESFTNADAAKKYIQEKGAPIVVKTDGLAAGKGVVVAMTEAEALTAVDEAFGGKFGAAGKKVVIEEFLDGEEASFFAICDGKTAIACGSAQDHKRVGEGDTGLNTGGMGTYAPAPVMTHAINGQVMRDIIRPTIAGMAKDGKPYVGFLFAGLMIKNGVAKLIEFNVRFGDPEAQVVLPRIESDMVELMQKATHGELNATNDRVRFSTQTALCVVMAANGYPEAYQKGTEIHKLNNARLLEDVTIFHAGTEEKDGKILAVGGRVLGVTALGNTVVAAKEKAYQAVDTIDWPDGFCRRDIGWRAINRPKISA